MSDERTIPIPPQSLDQASIREARERLKQDAPLSDDDTTKDHEIGNDEEVRTPSTSTIPVMPPD